MAISYFGYYAYNFNSVGYSSLISAMADHSNIVIPAAQLTDAQYQTAIDNQVKVCPNVQHVFFNGATLKSDYVPSFNSWKAAYNISARVASGAILGFYLYDEPKHNGVSSGNLATAANHIKAQFPNTPLFYVEAYTQVSTMVIPNAVDWVGFDMYHMMNPATDSWLGYSYTGLMATMKARRTVSPYTGSLQKIVIVMDSYHPSYHDGAGITPAEMGQVATNYFNYANTVADTIAIVAFCWDSRPAGTGGQSPYEGAEDLPEAEAVQHTRGQAITGKPYATPPAPTIHFESPAADALISGNLIVVTHPESTGTISNVDYYVDGVWFTSEQSAEWGFTHDTTSLTNGYHTYSALVTDSIGQTGTASRRFNIQNTPAVVYPALNPTGFSVGGADLSTIFRGRVNTKIANTGYTVNNAYYSNQDLSDICEPIASGSAPAATNIKVGGADLNTLFSRKET